MPRRHLPYVAFVATTLWLAPGAAQAGKYDVDLTTLGSTQTGVLVQDQAGFRSLSSELGTLMAPRPVDPADSLGLAGFAVSADFGVNTLGAGRSYWASTTGGQAQQVAPTLQVIARKGLWPGTEFGGGATHLFSSGMWAIAGYGKVALHEGFHHLPIPSISLRGTFSRLLGARDLNLTTAAVAVTVSHVFGVGKTFSLTPYGGYEALFIGSRSTVLQTTPNCDPVPDGYNDVCPDGRPNPAEFAFNNAGAILRHRPFVGARMLFSVMRLSFEAMFVPKGRRAGKLGGVSIPDRSTFQQQYTFSVGLDF